MSTMDMPPEPGEIEARLRTALAARAEQVQPEDLAQLASVVDPRPRWQSPWTLLATAAVVLLVLGVVFQGLGSNPRSDRIAPEPEPDAPTIELPADIGRDWDPDNLSTPARLDLDGDGTREEVVFLAEPTADYDGRTRVQTTLSSTGEEAYGLVELGTTIGTSALDPIDADGDGDQELVLYTTAVAGGPGAPFEPVVLDLREGLLVRAVPEDPQLLANGDVVVPGSTTPHYDLVHVQTFRVEGETLRSSRSVSAFARTTGGMTLIRPEAYVVDTYAWTLDDEGVLRPGEEGCLVQELDGTRPCDADSTDALPEVMTESTDTIGVGEQVALEDGVLGYRARVEDDGGATLVVDGPGADGSVYALNAPEPRVNVVSPASLVGFDAASVYVTSATDPGSVEVVVQTADQAGLVALQPVGEIALGAGTNKEGRTYRSWLTGSGAVVTAVAADDGSWETWQWVRAGEVEMAALPWGTVCFDDVEDPTTGRAC